MILAFTEHDAGRVSDASLEVLTFARGLAGRTGWPLAAVLVDGDAHDLAPALGAHGADEVIVAQHAQLDTYAPAAWAQVLAGLEAELAPVAILAAGTDRGQEVMAHLASLLDLPLAANCVALEPAAGAWAVQRQRWGGSLLEEARLEARVKLLTLALHAVAAEPAAAGAPAAVRTVVPQLSGDALRVRLRERVESASDKVSLAEARVVVGGGRGVGGAEEFALLEELAALLGGTVGASRVVTSLGWRPHSDQVGQTGTRIAPELYIACGISGAIQHMVGAKGAKHILAINSDPDAPIMSLAQYTVVGDLHEVLGALVEELARRAAGGS